MKIWIKLIIGSGIGIFVSIFYPDFVNQAEPVLSYISNLVIHFGRFLLFPLIFFSLAIGIHELRQEKKLLKTYGRAVFYTIVATFVFALVGVLMVLIFSPDRIPIIIEEEAAFSIPGLQEILIRLFPKDFFSIFIENGNFILPIYIFAVFFGLNFAFDRLSTRPVNQFFDSISRIFYHANTFVLEILPVGIMVVVSFLIVRMQNVPELSIFSELFFIIGVATAFVVLVLLPLIMYLLTGGENPYKWLYAIIAPAVTGFISGDIFFSYGMMVKHGKESFGVPRKTGAPVYPLLAMFSKAGTAMVSVITFFIIITSYSNLEIQFAQILWILVMAFLLSFVLFSVPASGVIVLLSLLCSMYGNGIEEGFLIIKPVAPLLMSFGVFLDVITASFIAYLTARHEGLQKEIRIRDYV